MTTDTAALQAQIDQLTSALAQERAARRLAEKYLHDVSAQNQNVIDLFPHSILMLRDKVIVRDNKIARRLLCGDFAESLVGQSFLDYVHPSDRAHIAHLLDRLQAEEAKSIDEEVRLLSSPGETCFTRIQMMTVIDAGQQTQALIITDKTPARRLARTLSEREQRYRQLLALMPDGVAVHKNGRVIYINEAGLRILRLNSPDEILGRLAIHMVHPDDRAAALERIQHIMQTGENTGFIEERFLQGDGNYVTVEVAAFPFTEKEEAAVEVVFRDISEYKKMLAKLQKSEARFRTLAETTNAAIFMFDRANLLYVNPAAITLTGYSFAELRQLKPWEIIHPAQQASVKREFLALLRGEKNAYNDRIRIKTKEGEIRWFDYKARLIKAGGETIVLGTGFDITDLLEIQWQMEQYMRRLEALREIDAAGLTSHTLEDITLVAFQQLATLINTDRISVFLLDTKTKTAQMISERDRSGNPLIPEGIFRLQVPPEIYTQMGRGDPLIVPDIERMLDVSSLFARLYQQGIRSFISAPLRVQGAHLGSINIGSRHTNAFTDTDIQIAQEVAGRLAVALQNVRLYNELKKSHTQLESLSYRLVQIQEEERRRIARDLHDEVGQALTGLKLILDRMDTEPVPALQADIGEAQELVTGLMDQIRELYLDLRPILLDDLGLLPTLLWYFDRYRQRTTLSVHFSHNGLNRRFDNEIETTAYRIIQEALTNIARHAKAKNVDVMVWAEAESIEIQISDDGVGFEQTALNNNPNSSGITGMRERIKHLGGSLQIQTAPGKGVEIIATLPLFPDQPKS